MKITQFKVEAEFELAMPGDTRADYLHARVSEVVRTAVKQYAEENRMFVDGMKISLERIKEVA